MPSFDKEFLEAKGQSITYKGKRLVRLDRFPITSECHLRLTFESTKSKWQQGVAVETDKWVEHEGERSVKGFRFWERNAPKIIKFHAESGTGELLVWNVWDTGSGETEAWINGSAMIVEEIPNGRRYYCNDGEPDDDFDDLIFKIERFN